jgi:hypothetical protein
MIKLKSTCPSRVECHHDTHNNPGVRKSRIGSTMHDSSEQLSQKPMRRSSHVKRMAITPRVFTTRLIPSHVATPKLATMAKAQRSILSLLCVLKIAEATREAPDSLARPESWRKQICVEILILMRVRKSKFKVRCKGRQPFETPLAAIPIQHRSVGS